MGGARVITAIGRVIVLVCIVMTQIARRPGSNNITNKLVSRHHSDDCPRRDRLGQLGMSINNTVFNTSVASELADETLAGIRVFIVGGSRRGVRRDHRRPACYNGGVLSLTPT